jgi:hypothetical protein
LAGKENMNISDDALALLAEHGGGSFRDAIGLLDQIGNSKNKITRKDVEELIGIAPIEAINALLKAVIAGSPSDILACLNGFIEQGIAPAQIAKQTAKSVRAKILEGDYSHKYIMLLADLLGVPASQDPSMTLEIALFTANFDSQNNDSKLPTPASSPLAHIKADSAVVKIPPKPAAKTPPEVEGIIEPTAKSTKTSEPKPTIIDNLEDISSWWPSLVNSVKKHNNTLYGVLRMAHPQFSGDHLRLGFGFGLHTKKIADTQTTKKLQELIKDITGKDVSIEAVLDKSLKSVEPSLAIAATPSIAQIVSSESSQQSDANLGAITSIFGGGEVIES